MQSVCRAWIVGVGACLACGRGALPAATGSDGGTCYGNATCDAGLVCAPNNVCIDESVFACDSVTCSGRGRCSIQDGRPACTCDAGFHAEALSCVAGCSPTTHAAYRCDGGSVYWFDGCGARQELKEDCGGGACIDGACSRCPPEMVEVSVQSLCVDRYEATVFERPDCTGARLGVAGFDDYPSSFPDYVESSGCTGVCLGQSVVAPTVELYACSLAGAEPSSHITWFQAKRACESSGKRLCDSVEWRSACGGPLGNAYPYGPVEELLACNIAALAAAQALPAGQTPTCEGGYPGLFDMVGNLAEWLSGCPGAVDCYASGANFSTPSSPTPSCATQGWYPASTESPQVGFRCCRDR